MSFSSVREEDLKTGDFLRKNPASLLERSERAMKQQSLHPLSPII